MDVGFLVATQLSSLFPSQATSIPLQTVRQDIPLPPAHSESDAPAEHATYSSVLHTPVTGTVLLRVIHGGLIVELVSLSTEIPPLRLIFPGPIIPSPAVFLWESKELHVLAIADIGSLYRVVIPVGSGRELWQHQIANVWPREYLLKNFPDLKHGLVHVHGIDCVAVGLPNGSLLRLENNYIGEESNDEWSETLFQHSSFLSSLTSFLPALSTSTSSASEIVSIATHPWPTDVGHVWTLSRDRTLRFWKAKIGCVASKSLSPGRESSPSPGTSAGGVKPHILLDSTPQTLLRIFSRHLAEEHVYVLAFIPTVSSPASGGSFHVFDTETDQLYEIGKLDASKNTAHCHLQDFMITDDSLIVLWDRQGQSFVEKTVINVEHLDDSHATVWHASSYAPEPELTPAYLEEHLLSPGSLTDKFFEAVMRPGMFSALTLRTAIDQYTDACLSLPNPRPPQLATTYATISEHIAAVVGCTVNLNRDPQTGAYQYDNYWNALKRDWEGFIARCREVERSARRPLILGVQDQGEIIIVERERVGSLVGEDLPVHLRRRLSIENAPIESQYELFAILCSLRNSLGPRAMLNLENRVLDILHQEIAFSFPDILQDQARRFQFREEMDDGSVHWIIGRLQSIDDLDAATRTALDVIGGFDVEVKREEDEVELLLPPSHSDWWRALTATYVAKSVDARYDLCLSLVTLLFFLADDLSDWDPSLLAEIFAVFRGVAMLRFVIRQPAGQVSVAPSLSSDINTPDDVVSRMRNMNVSQNRTHLSPTYSIIHRLLAQSGDNHGLPGAAHRFLDATGLLQSVSPAHATKYEVLFCERLRLLSFYYATEELLSWLPRTAGASYTRARLWLNLSRADDASLLLEKLGGSFGADHSLSAEDQEALALILPATELFDSQYAFYVHVSNLFKACSLVQQEVSFAQLAISTAPVDADTSFLWHTVIKGCTDLALYDDAYAALMSTPYEKLKRDCVSHLAYRMCEDSAVERLLAFNFAGMADEVEDALAFKARNVDPRLPPIYSKILYAWFIRRGDYRSAALAMYQRAKKLQDLTHDPLSFSTLAEEQLEAYTVAINALSLVDLKNAWVLLPISADHGHEPRKRRKLSRHIPENKFTPGKFDADIIRLSDMQYDYALLSAQIDMVRREPTLLSSPEFLLSPSVIVLRLAQAHRFTLAMSTARSLKVDMTDLFSHLTSQCLRLSRNPDAVIQEDTSDWLLTDKVSSWPGTPADRGWRFLRQSLQRHDNADTDYKYSKATLETILGVDRSSPPPPWLTHILEEHHHEYLIRLSLRFENFEQAIEYTLSLIRKSDAQLARDAPQNACATWLPYALIDQVLIAATAQDSSTPRLSALRLELTSRVKRMQKLSRFSR